MNKIKYFSILLIVLLTACGANVAPMSIVDTPYVVYSTHPPEPTLTTTAATPAPASTVASTETGKSSAASTAELPTTAPQSTTASISNGSVQVHIIDVGQGDSILIKAPDGSFGLIDGGEADSGAVAYLQSQGVTRLSLVVATHPHSDHIGGLVEVLKTFPVDRVVTNGEPHTTLVYEHFLDAIATAKAQYIEVKGGDNLSIGGLALNVLSSGGVSSSDMNQNSVVLRMVYGKTAFLFMGDAGKDAEATMLSSGQQLTADILKVGHHGSRTASSPAFLAKVQPKVAVYSAGTGNDYGHPHAETIAALTAIGAQILGTDKNGTVVVTADGSGYSIQTAKQGNAQAPPPVATTIQATAPPTVKATVAVLPTVAPTVEATEAIQPTAPPTVKPTEVPQPTQVIVAELSIAVTSLTSPISPGKTASLTVKTLPGAACSITVYYKSGPSGAAGLGPKTADGNGNVSWTWKVGPTTTKGTWRIVVTASANGQSVNQEIPFVVQ